MTFLKRITPLLAMCLLCSSLVSSQDKARDQKQVNQASPVASATPKPPLAFGLTEDTPVKIKLARTMSSSDAKAGEKVDFEVLEDVKIDDVIVIQHGAMAIGTVTEAHPKRRMGRAGKLNINIDYVQLVSGEKAPLRAVKGGSGGNHTGAMTGAMVATGILFFPAAPFFLFMHGKDITIPKGTEIAAYIAGDTPLDPAKFNGEMASASSSAAQVESRAQADSAVLSNIVITSTPGGADINIDGKFLGNTPSTLRLAAGEHSIVIEKSGFNPWQRSITVTNNGSITVAATLATAP
jgi:hypothetical protein